MTIARAAAREADWRFLLPAPHDDAFAHLLLLGGSAALAATIVELGVARRVSLHVDPSDRAEAIVILSTARATIDAAAAALVEGGVLYWEIDRRRPAHFGRTPARTNRHLRRLGLRPASTYWVKPGFPERDMYLPVSHDAAVTWYLNTLYRGGTWPRRVLRRAVNSLRRMRVPVGALPPCFAVTAVRGCEGTPALLARARDHRLIPAAVEPVLLAHAHTDWGRVAMVCFERGTAASPIGVIKCGRTPQLNAQAAIEHRTLNRLAGRLPSALRGSIPRSSLFEWRGVTVTMQTCVEGAALTARAPASPRTATRDLSLVAGWLAAFHRSTAGARVPADIWLSRHLGGLITRYSLTFGTTGAERSLFERASLQIGTTAGLGIPLVCQHTDFGPWNIYLAGDRIAVIDWEVARSGPALVDLLYFVTHSIGAKPLVLAIGGDSTAGRIRPTLEDYMDHLDIAPALLPFLLLYTFLEQALERSTRLGTFAPEKLATRAANPYVTLIALLAHQADHLFPSELSRAA